MPLLYGRTEGAPGRWWSGKQQGKGLSERYHSDTGKEPHEEGREGRKWVHWTQEGSEEMTEAHGESKKTNFHKEGRGQWKEPFP